MIVIQDKLGVFMENEKFKQCFEDVLNVSNDYLNVVLRLTKSGTINEVASPRFAFLDFWGCDLVIGSFSEGKGFMDITESVRSDNCNCCVMES